MSTTPPSPSRRESPSSGTSGRGRASSVDGLASSGLGTVWSREPPRPVALIPFAEGERVSERAGHTRRERRRGAHLVLGAPRGRDRDTSLTPSLPVIAALLGRAGPLTRDRGGDDRVRAVTLRPLTRRTAPPITSKGGISHGTWRLTPAAASRGSSTRTAMKDTTARRPRTSRGPQRTARRRHVPRIGATSTSQAGRAALGLDSGLGAVVARDRGGAVCIKAGGRAAHPAAFSGERDGRNSATSTSLLRPSEPCRGDMSMISMYYTSEYIRVLIRFSPGGRWDCRVSQKVGLFVSTILDSRPQQSTVSWGAGLWP